MDARSPGIALPAESDGKRWRCGVAKFITIGYGDEWGYERTRAELRDAAVRDPAGNRLRIEQA